ncbi:MAG: DUF2207 domain-containing protein [Clostridia bacterium]|nr:DUF2207 domain-containing protein [Clostridia bacterium]
MKRSLKISLYVFILLLLSVFAALLLCGDNYGAAKASVDDNYSFTDIHTVINVRKDKTYEITERLTVFFKRGGVNTGIIRDIQRVSKTTRIIDGKNHGGGKYIAGIDRVSVTLDGGECKVTQSLYSGGQFYSVKMQKPDGYFGDSSTHVFELSYIYDQSGDKLGGYDDFTLDVLGYAMAMTDSFSAKIIFPDGTDLSDVSVRSNDMSEWKPNFGKEEKISVSGSVIEISAAPQSANKGYTVQVILPDGYFERVFKFNYYYFIFIGVALAGVALAFFLVFGLKRKPLQTVEFYPPDGMGVLRFASVWRAGAKNKDVAALLLKWAGKGLISIERDGKKDVVLKANVIKARKKAPSNRLAPEMLAILESPEERQYFDTLFGGIGGLNYTFSTKYYKKRKNRLEKERLYSATQELIKEADRRPYYVKRDTLNSVVSYLIGVVSLIPLFAAMGWYCFLWQQAVPVVFMTFMIFGTLLLAHIIKEKNAVPSAILVFWNAVLFAMFIYLYFMPAYDYFGLTYVAPLFWIVGAFVLPNYIAYRTEKSYGDYGKLLGFKGFLLKAELPKIQLLFDENPEYFTDILPYCLIMGVSDRIKKRFAALNIKVPEYVENNVDLRSFSSGMAHASSYAPRVSHGGGGGSSSGGGGGSSGSSGGGGGGGGSRGC